MGEKNNSYRLGASESESLMASSTSIIRSRVPCATMNGHDGFCRKAKNKFFLTVRLNAFNNRAYNLLGIFFVDTNLQKSYTATRTT